MSHDPIRELPDNDELRARLRSEEAAVPTSRLSRLLKTGRGALGLATLALGNRKRSPNDEESSADVAALLAMVSRIGTTKGVAMKAAQVLSYTDASLPAEVRRVLATLQTSSARTPPKEVRETLTTALGERGRILSAALEPEPLAVASIGQVHRCRLPDGREVVVKIRHPGVVQALEADFQNASTALSFASVLVPGSAAGARGALEEVREAILAECDFKLEGQRQLEFRQFFRGHPSILIPEVFPDWSASSVLTQAWEPGQSLEEVMEAGASQEARSAYGVALFELYLGTLYRHGLLHADPHPGNYAFRTDGRVIIYDFGCVRQFDAATVRAFAKLAASVRDEDGDGIQEALRSLGANAKLGDEEMKHLQVILRGFFSPLMARGSHAIPEGFAAPFSSVLRDKRLVARLQLPGRLLFLFRLRFGLFSVLARLGSMADWRELESSLSSQAQGERNVPFVS